MLTLEMRIRILSVFEIALRYVRGCVRLSDAYSIRCRSCARSRTCFIVNEADGQDSIRIGFDLESMGRRTEPVLPREECVHS